MFNFDNIGDKIKGLALFFSWIGIVASVLGGIALLPQSFPTGILIIILGSIVSYVSSWLLYGFGELVESACEIKEYLAKANNTDNLADKAKRITALKKLRAEGKITESYFNELIEKINHNN